MTDAAIVGAGELGGAVADLLARRDAVSTIRLVDETTSVASGKALDIMQSAPIGRFATTVLADSQLHAGDRVDVIVIADRVRHGEWQEDDGLMLVKRLADLQPAAIILCAGAAQRALVERAVRELHIDRQRIVGSAPEALSSAIRALIALEINGSARDVAVAVLGIPPSHTVVPWEESTIAGLQTTRFLPEPARRRVAAQIPALWPPGTLALAAAAVEAIDAVLERSRRRISCFVGPDDSSGIRTRAAALPVRLGRNGIASVAVPPLNAHDRVALENAMML